MNSLNESLENVIYCIDPRCRNRENPQDLVLGECKACGTSLLLQGRYYAARELYKNPLCGTEIFEVQEIDSDENGSDIPKIIKVLNSDAFPDYVPLFKKQVTALERLNNSGIPKIFLDECFPFETKRCSRLYCIVMEKIEGQNLEDLVEEKGQISQEEALNWLKQITQILGYVHKKRYFHRDIKPSNIMHRPDGQLVLIDFDSVEEVATTYFYKLKRLDVIPIDSYGYTAPEQRKGQATPKSDYFALGRTFVHLLTGRHPTEFNENPETGKLMENWRDSAKQISEGVADLIDELMAPLPKNRPRNLRVILERLERLVAEPSSSAMGLSVISQNLPNVSGIEQQLPSRNNRDRAIKRQYLHPVFLASVVVTILVMSVRQTGLLQPSELQALDQQMRLRPSEGWDQRILLVQAREEDINKYRFPLPDAVLAKLLAKLEQYQPRVIGLDIYRDNPVNYSDIPVEPNYTDLPTQLRQNNRLIPICKVSSASDSGISPLPGIPVERLGFSNVLEDSDRAIRRHLLYQTPSSTSPCKTPYALNLQLAFRYLEAEGISPKFTREGDLQFGNTVFKDLEPRTGGYQSYDAGGQQVLLNYRASEQIAQEVTLSDVLNGRLDPNWVNNRVVLIGVTATSQKDIFNTPYGERRGLLIQAYMVSQILSAVLDGRPLLQAWPQWGDALWIWGWSLVGGVLAWRFRSVPLRMLGGGTACGALYGLCFVFLIQGDWVPLVPPAIAFVASGSCVVALLRLGQSVGTALIVLGGLGFLFLIQATLVPLVPAAIALVTTSGIVVIYTILQARRR